MITTAILWKVYIEDSHKILKEKKAFQKSHCFFSDFSLILFNRNLCLYWCVDSVKQLFTLFETIIQPFPYVNVMNDPTEMIQHDLEWNGITLIQKLKPFWRYFALTVLICCICPEQKDIRKSQTFPSGVNVPRQVFSLNSNAVFYPTGTQIEILELQALILIHNLLLNVLQLLPEAFNHLQSCRLSEVLVRVLCHGNLSMRDKERQFKYQEVP